MIEIIVNNKKMEIKNTSTLEDLIFHQFQNTNLSGIAIALNDHVISRDAWEKQTLIQGDKILIIKATQGG